MYVETAGPTDARAPRRRDSRRHGTAETLAAGMAGGAEIAVRLGRDGAWRYDFRARIGGARIKLHGVPAAARALTAFLGKGRAFSGLSKI